jgi:hypothetical protein
VPPPPRRRSYAGGAADHSVQGASAKCGGEAECGLGRQHGPLQAAVGVMIGTTAAPQADSECSNNSNGAALRAEFALGSRSVALMWWLGDLLPSLLLPSVAIGK